MPQINLLPWRKESRKHLTRVSFAWLGLVTLFSIMLVAIWAWVTGLALQNQRQRNAYLESNSAEMDKMVAEITELKNKRQELLLRIKVIQDLQDGRVEVVSFFDQLVQAMPEGIFLTKLERRGVEMTLHGFAESNHQLSMLMRNLNRSPIYDDASLVKVQQNNQHGNQVSAFNLQVAVGTTTSQEF